MQLPTLYKVVVQNSSREYGKMQNFPESINNHLSIFLSLTEVI